MKIWLEYTNVNKLQYLKTVCSLSKRYDAVTRANFPIELCIDPSNDGVPRGITLRVFVITLLRKHVFMRYMDWSWYITSIKGDRKHQPFSSAFLLALCNGLPLVKAGLHWESPQSTSYRISRKQCWQLLRTQTASAFPPPTAARSIPCLTWTFS